MSTSLTRPVRLALAAAASAAALLVAAPGASAGPCAGAGASPGVAPSSVVSGATLCLLNLERASHGLRRVRLNRKLSKAARRHAEDMVRHRYFAHDSRSGADFVSRIRRAGYLRKARYWTVGENLAWGDGNRATPASIVDAWMNSPEHRANILDPAFRDIGVWIAPGAPESYQAPAGTYATEFGARR